MFFVRAVGANAGAEVRCGCELQLAQAGSFLAIAWKDKGEMFEERRPHREIPVYTVIAVCLHVNVRGCFVLELIGKSDHISLLLKEGICRGQQL